MTLQNTNECMNVVAFIRLFANDYLMFSVYMDAEYCIDSSQQKRSEKNDGRKNPKT